MIDLEKENLNTIFKAAEIMNSAEDVRLVEHEGQFQVAMSLEKFQHFQNCESVAREAKELMKGIISQVGGSQ